MKTPVSRAAVLANIKIFRARSNDRRAANSMEEPNSSGGISMKPVIRSTMVAAALAFAFGGPAAAANESHEHDHAGHDAVQYAKLDLNAGKKWSTDAPLRSGMENIRAALAAELGVIKSSRRLSAEEYAALATWMNDEVAGIVQNCKLEPEADAQLHKVIAQIATGVEAMAANGTGASRRAAAQRVAQALGEYERYFDHPGWQKL